MLRENWVAREVSLGRTWEYAGTSRHVVESERFAEEAHGVKLQKRRLYPGWPDGSDAQKSANPCPMGSTVSAANCATASSPCGREAWRVALMTHGGPRVKLVLMSSRQHTAPPEVLARLGVRHGLCLLLASSHGHPRNGSGSTAPATRSSATRHRRPARRRRTSCATPGWQPCTDAQARRAVTPTATAVQTAGREHGEAHPHRHSHLPPKRLSCLQATKELEAKQKTGREAGRRSGSSQEEVGGRSVLPRHGPKTASAPSSAKSHAWTAGTSAWPPPMPRASARFWMTRPVPLKQARRADDVVRSDCAPLPPPASAPSGNRALKALSGGSRLEAQ